MSKLPGFVDQSNVARSVDIDVERTVNLVWEASAANPKVPASLYSRPGIAPWLDMGQGPVRALFTQDDRVFGVGGTRFVELFAGQTAVIRGTVVSDGNPATICSNGGSDGSGGHQLFITSGGHGYIFDLVANTLVEITAEGFPRPALMGFFIDGYFGVLKTASNQFNLSHLEDGLTWDALDVAELSQQPGWVLSAIVSHNQLWPFTASRVNPWYDSGATFPLQPVLGADVQVGILAPWSAAVMDNTLYWLGQTLAGGAQVFLADGYSAKRISTHALETRLQGLPQVSDAVAWTCQLDGHSFYILYLAHNDTHWVYDAASQRWTEWAHWDSDAEVWTPFRGRCHTFGFGRHLVGDLATGMVYELSNALYTDRRIGMKAWVGTVRVRTGVGAQPVTGIVDRDGLPFTPEHVFVMNGSSVLNTLHSDPTGAFTAASANTTDYHAATGASAYGAIGDCLQGGLVKVACGAGGPATGLASLKAQAAFGGNIYRIAQITAVASGGFTLTVTTDTITVPTDVLLLVLGSTSGDLQLEYLGVGIPTPLSFEAKGLLNPCTYDPSATGSAHTSPGGGNWGWGWDSPNGGPMAAAAVIVSGAVTLNYRGHTHASYDCNVNAGPPPVTVPGPAVTTWGATSVLLSGPLVNTHHGWAIGGTQIVTASGAFTQAATAGPQVVRTGIDAVALLLVSTGLAPAAPPDTVAECCAAWTDGIRQGSFWVGETATGPPLTGAVYVSDASLLRFTAAGATGASTTFAATATLGEIAPTGTFTIHWTATDGVGREILWFAIGAPPPPPIPPPPPGTIEPIRRLRQAPHLWTGENTHRLKYPGFQLLVEAGAPRDTDGPMSWVLQWSDDGGHSWSHEHRIEGSRLGEHTFRFWWRRLGQSRDRVFRVVNSDDAKIVVIDALLVPDPVEGSS